VLDLIYDIAIDRTIVRYDSLEDKVADEIVAILFGGLDNRCQEKAGITRKTHHNHTIRIVSKLSRRTAFRLKSCDRRTPLRNTRYSGFCVPSVFALRHGRSRDADSQRNGKAGDEPIHP